MFVSKTANNSCKKVTMILENNTWCKCTAKTQTGKLALGCLNPKQCILLKC